MPQRRQSCAELPWDPWEDLWNADHTAGWWPCMCLHIPAGVHKMPGIPSVDSGWVRRVVSCWYQTLQCGTALRWWVVTLYSSDGSVEAYQWTDDEWWGHWW